MSTAFGILFLMLGIVIVVGIAGLIAMCLMRLADKWNL